MPTVELTRLKVLVLSDGRPAYQIAASAGIHPSTFSQYVKGQMSFRQKDLAKLAKEFGVDEGELTGWFRFEVAD